MPPISFARGAPALSCLDPGLLSDCARAALERDGTTILSYGTGGGYGPLRELPRRGARRRSGAGVPDDRGPSGVRLLLRRAARAAAGAGARRGAHLRPPAEAARLAGSRERGARDGRRGSRPGCPRGRAGARRRRVVPLHHPHVPEPERPHPERGAAAEDRGALPQTRRGRARGRPVRPRPVRGDGAAGAPRAGGRRARRPITSSFSKTVAPGLRVGWFVVPDDLRSAYDERAVSTYISPPLLPQAIVHELFARGGFEPNLERIRVEFCGPSATRCWPRSTTSWRGGRPGAAPRADTSCGSTSAPRPTWGTCSVGRRRRASPSSAGRTSSPGRRRCRLRPARVLLRGARADRRGRPHPRRAPVALTPRRLGSRRPEAPRAAPRRRSQYRVRGAGGAPDAVEPPQRLVHDRRQLGVVSERRDPPIANPVASRASSALAGRPSTAVTRRSPEHSTTVGAPWTTKTSDLTICPTSRPAGGRGLRGGARQVGQDLHLDHEPARGEPVANLRRRRMHGPRASSGGGYATSAAPRARAPRRAPCSAGSARGASC